MNETGLRRIPPDQSSGSAHTVGTSRYPSVIDPILSKRVCFYKSGDPQFNGLLLVINNRTFKTFDTLLDSLSKKVPLPFGVRNITTPRGVHAINTLDELEDGKSYICSDSRKVKPINLALARKKLPPWYHARPLSSRRRTEQQARLERGLMRTPKRLLVFRNGDPTVKHTVVLHKKNTPSYESIREYISELMQFHVVKLHTTDGRRVDGLPGLILCSGTVVAVGREPFRPAIYRAWKSPPSTWQHSNQTGLRRQKTLNRKKRPLSYSSRLRNFSQSSERYIVHQIHDTIAKRSCDMPSHPTNSAELESNHRLESVAETGGDTCDGAERQDCSPNQDDIEKSFRVNHDGSMTVEMRVRLTVKEEETIHWTTTLSRSSVANQLTSTRLPEPDAEQIQICSPQQNSPDLQSPVSSIDTINKDKTKDDSDDDPPSLGNGALTESSTEEEDIKDQSHVAYPRRPPTPGYEQVSKKQASVESIRSMTADGIQEGMVGSYAYIEQTENETMTEQYCMIKQSSSKPIPKPRRLGSFDVSSQNVSSFKSAGMSEILQTESSGEEVTENVLHIYEQQTFQDNFLANVFARGMSYSRPATSETGHLFSNIDFEPELWRPSTASESFSMWRAESMSVTSDFNLHSLKTGAIQATNRQQQFKMPTKGQVKHQQREGSKDKRVSSKPKVINKHVRRLLTPTKRKKENSAEAKDTHKKVKPFSSAGYIKKIYGNKLKSAKSKKKLKKRPTENGDGDVTTKSSKVSDEMTVTDPNTRSALKENTSENISSEISSTTVSHRRGTPTRETSMHMDEKSGNESYDISESMSLPAFNSSSSVTNEYVENWLEKAHLSPQTTNGGCGKSENKRGEITVAEDVKCLGETSEVQTCQTSEPPSGSSLGTSVKLRVQSLENKSTCPSVARTTASQQSVHNHTNTTNAENRKSLSLSSGIVSEISSPTNKTLTSLSGEVENKTNPVKISLQDATPSNTFSMELPPPPSPAEITELSNTDYCVEDVSSVASSALYRLSSQSSERTDDHLLAISPTSDTVISPIDDTTEITTSVETDIPSTLREAPLQRTPSNKRAPLVSNLSFERKMFLRKACLDKYTLSSDATSETATESTPINTVGDDVSPNGVCSTETQQPIKASPEETRQTIKASPEETRQTIKAPPEETQQTIKAPPEETQQTIKAPPEETQQPIKAPPEETQQPIIDSMSIPICCTSVSPASLTSEDRMSSASILSGDASMPTSFSFKETKTTQTPLLAQKEKSSPKVLVKKAKLKSSPSPERKFQNKKSFELPNNSPKLSLLHRHPQEKTMSPNIGVKRNATPSPSPERKQKLYESKMQKRLSPYSQSLDIVSPPVKHKSNRKLLSRNLSSDNPSEPTNSAQRKSPSPRKSHQTPQSVEPAAEVDKTLTWGTPMPLEDDHNADLITTDQETSMTDMQIIPQPLNIANQPNMKPVLEKICYSIKSIRQITQNKRPSCLEKSNSLPDFSSHVASTFGSSSKALLAFLSIMTLKEDMTNLNINELNANSVSCAEALKMINSLIEIASIEDAHELKASLLSLQQSASKQLLHSWKGFQELGDRCKSRSSTPNCSEHELMTSPEQSYDSEENFINELMDNLYIPEKLKEEIASFSVGTKSESDDEEKMSARIIERAELSPKEISDEDASHLSTEGVCDVTQNEKANADVRSIIKQFTDINQPKQSVMDSSYLITKTAKHKPPGQTAKDNDGQHGQNGATKRPPAEIPEERQPYGTTSCVQESGQDLQSCSDAVHEDSQEEQQGHDDDKLSEERANINRAVSSEKIIEKCSFKTEEKDMECRQLQTQSEGSMSIPENELTPSEESGSDEEGQRTSSANEDLEEKESSEQSVSSSEAGRRPSSEEEESEVACEEIKQESSEVEASSNPESHSEEEEEKQPSSNFYAELTAGGKESLSSPDQFLSEEEQPEIEFNDLSSKVDLSSPVRVSNVDKEQQRVTFSMGLSDSVDESTGDSDKVEQSSSEDCSRLQVIVEESSSGLEEEQEEEHLHVLSHDAKQTEKCKDLTTLIEESEEDEVTSGDEGKTHICEKTKTQITISSDLSTGNQDSYTKKDNSRLIKPDGLSKGYRFNADVDSGNGHSSSGEHAVEEQSKVGDEQISSSVQENLSCYEKKSSSVDEKVNVERYLKESRTQYQETLEKSEVTQCEMAVEKLKHQSQKIVSQSVAERVILLEKQVADAQKIKSSTARRLSHKNNPLEPEDSSAEAPTSQLDLCTRSAPQSSLSFSYDCSGGITTEPEPNRVKSIREMFLAKSATDVQQRCFPNPNVTNPSAVRAETSVSGGYESQTSSEPSSGEEDTARKNITKGFVRRTIDRLYGKKDADADPDEEALERPPSEPKQKKKEPSSIFSPFNAARAKALSELSYFNSTHALDTLTEATRCIAFNAQVGPGDSVPIDSGRWVFRENMLIRKSVSDPIGINKIFTNTPEGEGMLKDTEENTPFSLFSAKSELEKQAKSISEKCTYFSLPHASDSDVCEDEPSAVSNSSASDSVTEAKDNSEDTKIWAERNGKLPGVSVSDFRMMDNKVHPLIEPTLEGEVVVVQPGKGHGIVNRRLQEPDLLDFVYNFCGQHCPIL